MYIILYLYSYTCQRLQRTLPPTTAVADSNVTGVNDGEYMSGSKPVGAQHESQNLHALQETAKHAERRSHGLIKCSPPGKQILLFALRYDPTQQLTQHPECDTPLTVWSSCVKEITAMRHASLFSALLFCRRLPRFAVKSVFVAA
jgi:hypothetical protein